MDFLSFRGQFDQLSTLADRTSLLLDFAEEAMQSFAAELEPLLERVRTENLDAGQRRNAGLCDRLLGWLAVDRADYALALERFERALEAFLALHDEPGRLKALNGIASVHMSQGRFETALSVYRDAQQLAETLGDEAQGLLLQANIGETLIGLGQYVEAEGFLRRALAPGLLSPLNQSLMLNQIARVSLALNRPDEARSALTESIALSRGGGFSSSLAVALSLAGALDVGRGISEGTQGLLEEALAMARQAGDRAAEAQATISFGRLWLAQGKLPMARSRFEAARDLSRTIGAVPLEVEAVKGLATTLKAMGRWKQALEAYETFHEASARMHDETTVRQVARIKADQSRRETELYREQSRVLALLGDLGQKIAASLDLEAIVSIVYESIGDLMKADAFGLGLYDEDRGVIDYRLFIEDGRRVPPFEASVDAGTYAGWCLRHQSEVVVNDTERDFARYLVTRPPKFGDDARQSRSCLFLPLMAEGRAIGVLSTQSYRVNAYSERDLATLKTLAGSVSVAVENARLFDTIHRLAMVDSLTGAATRRHLFDRTLEEFERFRREKTPLALIMVDLDHFKVLNDTWGHAVGDQVLSEFGALCLAHKRPHDLFGRYGGEEFALVLSKTSLASALAFAERLCSLVAGLKVVTADGREVSVTASFGVASFAESDELITRVFDRADEALYQAKQAGRNRVASQP